MIFHQNIGSTKQKNEFGKITEGIEMLFNNLL